MFQRISRGSISIKYKLFIAILVGASALVLCLFLLMQWSFNRGFLQYVNALEHTRFLHMAENIESDYGQHKNWVFLRGNMRTWLKILVSSMPEAAASKKYLRRIETEIRRGGIYSGEPLLPGTDQTFEHRVFLLDEQHEILFGPPVSPPFFELKEITYQGRVVGYLGVIPGKAQYNAQQINFINDQMIEFHIAAGIMIIIAASLSLPLVHHIVKPVHTLAAAARQLAMGHYYSRARCSSRDEMGQLARDFNSMAKTLEKNQKARQQFFADISHELRTPLAVLRGELEAIQDGIHQATPQTIEILHGEVIQLSSLVTDLSDLALSDVGALAYRKEKFNLGTLLKERITHYRPEFMQKDIMIDAETVCSINLPVFADPQRMRQLVSNLLDNALKYTHDNGQFQIRLELQDSYFTLHLQDSAPAVPQSELPKLFDHFYRADRSRRSSNEGSGLGLAICKKIVEAHDGELTAKLSPLGGLWIQITLPLES